MCRKTLYCYNMWCPGSRKRAGGGIRHETMGVRGSVRVSRLRPCRGNLRCGAGGGPGTENRRAREGDRGEREIGPGPVHGIDGGTGESRGGAAERREGQGRERREGARRRLDGGSLYGNHNGFPEFIRFGGDEGGRGGRKGASARKKGLAVVRAEGERGESVLRSGRQLILVGEQFGLSFGHDHRIGADP